MKLIPNKLDYVSIVLAIASLVAVKMLYPDVFRGSRFWVLSGYLAAILGVLAVGGILYSQFKTNQIGLLTLVSAVIVLYGLWLVQDAANPDTRFRVLKDAYIRQSQSTDMYESSSYVSWDIKLDFFENPVADRLRADKALIDSLAKGLQVSERWKDLGRGIYYDYYIDQTRICYASLIEQGYSEAQIMEMPYGKNIMVGILFYELHKNAYYGTVPRKMQELLASLPPNPKGVFQKLSIGQIEPKPMTVALPAASLSSSPTSTRLTHFRSAMALTRRRPARPHEGAPDDPRNHHQAGRCRTSDARHPSTRRAPRHDRTFRPSPRV